MKLKIKSSARINKRYLLLNTDSKDSVEKFILDYIGILGWAKASPIFIKTNSKNIILAINRKEIDNIKAALEISNSNLKILKVSGTLKGLNL